MNGDGRPDLHHNTHRHRDAVFRNNGDGTFTNVTLQVDLSNTWTGQISDTHGASWMGMAIRI
ncbi:MAG: FG-GAP-like repeat-containing protein [Chromatiales bacterium]